MLAFYWLIVPVDRVANALVRLLCRARYHPAIGSQFCVAMNMAVNPNLMTMTRGGEVVTRENFEQMKRPVDDEMPSNFKKGALTIEVCGFSCGVSNVPPL